MSANTKTVFTTGEAAKICKVSQQTIIRCFDNGSLKGFRVPGSRFRRIPRNELYSFMRDNGIPTDALESGKRKLLIVDDDQELVELMSDAFARDETASRATPPPRPENISTLTSELSLSKCPPACQTPQPVRQAHNGRNVKMNEWIVARGESSEVLKQQERVGRAQDVRQVVDDPCDSIVELRAGDVAKQAAQEGGGDHECTGSTGHPQIVPPAAGAVHPSSASGPRPRWAVAARRPVPPRPPP